MLWDIFCKVIDNHGDLGVCWRLAAELAARGETARLWVDDASALAWMAPEGRAGVDVIRWSEPAPLLEPGDAIVEAFGCDPPSSFVAALRARTVREGRQPPWINLEYLCAEAWVERSHGLQSPVLSGPGEGLVKVFHFPGFTPSTGGLIREVGLSARKAAFDRAGWLGARKLTLAADETLMSLFCYEPPALDALLTQLAQGERPTRLLVTAGRAQAAVQRLRPGVLCEGSLSLCFLPPMSQEQYDELLWACDLNFVRGEDSLVRALWAAKPFVWQAYPQDDGAHLTKLEAFLAWLGAQAGLADFHRAWNGREPKQLPAPDLRGWAQTAELAARKAEANSELVCTLMRRAGRPATI